MATFTVDLTPSLVNPTTEGSLDTSVVNGLSKQRTFEVTMIADGANRKIVGRVADGGTYTDDTSYVNLYENQPGHPTSGDFYSGSTV